MEKEDKKINHRFVASHNDTKEEIFLEIDHDYHAALDPGPYRFYGVKTTSDKSKNQSPLNSPSKVFYLFN